MIKPASFIKLAFTLSVLVILFFPYKYLQAAAISIILIILVSYTWAKTLAKGIVVERNEAQIRTVSFEKLTISFTIINKSRVPAYMCYILDNIPFLSLQKRISMIS